MSKTKIQVIVEQGMPAPEKRDVCEVLREKIDYAVDCIEADCNKEQAIQFLQRMKDKLDSLPRPKDKHTALLEIINAALSDYGHYHLNGEQPNAEDS